MLYDIHTYISCLGLTSLHRRVMSPHHRVDRWEGEPYQYWPVIFTRNTPGWINILARITAACRVWGWTERGRWLMILPYSCWSCHVSQGKTLWVGNLVLLSLSLLNHFHVFTKCVCMFVCCGEPAFLPSVSPLVLHQHKHERRRKRRRKSRTGEGVCFPSHPIISCCCYLALRLPYPYPLSVWLPLPFSRSLSLNSPYLAHWSSTLTISLSSPISSLIDCLPCLSSLYSPYRIYSSSFSFTFPL